MKLVKIGKELKENQGEELGMTNVKFDSLSEYRDIETLNMYKEKRQQGIAHETIMSSIYAKGRDNARTPMQWTSNGGFTTGTPWIRMNTNTSFINAEQAIADPSSIFYTYQRLIQLRKIHAIITHGSFQLLLPDHPDLFVYKRQTAEEEWLIVNNFSEKTNQLVWKECNCC